jgi:hypothetical protein
MFIQLPTLSEANSADFTLKWSTTDVDAKMVLKVACLLEIFFALYAAVDAVCPVSFSVLYFRSLECSFLAELNFRGIL